jgi:hypothetical protein
MGDLKGGPLMEKRAAQWAEHLCHPLPLAAVAVLALNDHVFKGSGLLPAALTGKLSDVAGLFFFPLLLSAALRGGRAALGADARDSRWIALASALATGAAFTALKLWPAFNAAVSRLVGPNALDPTDLFALPAVIASYLWMRRRAAPRAVPRFAQLFAVAFAGVASMATSTVRPVQLQTGTPQRLSREVGCANVEAVWPDATAKTLQFEVTLTPITQPCALELRTAQLFMGQKTFDGKLPTGLLFVPSKGVIDFGTGPLQETALPLDATLVLMFGGPETNRASWDLRLPIPPK